MPASPTMALSKGFICRPLQKPLLLRKIKEIVGPGWTSDPARMEANLIEYRGLFLSRAQMVVTPGSVDEVSGVLALCNEAGIPVVPRAATQAFVAVLCRLRPSEIVLSLARMNKIRSSTARLHNDGRSRLRLAVPPRRKRPKLTAISRSACSSRELHDRR